MSSPFDGAISISTPQYSGGIEFRARITRTWLSGTSKASAKTEAPKASTMSRKLSMSKSLHPVATTVNTARSDITATLRSMTATKETIAQGRRLAEARMAAGYTSARAAALDNGWAESSYRAHENGTRTIGQDDAERYAKRFRSSGVKVSGKFILYGDGEQAEKNSPNVLTVVGFIGAGATVEPEFEQVPPEGLFSVELPFPIPEDMIGFEVRGDSMAPRYDEGDVIVVWKDQRRAADELVGEEAAVRTADGRRFVKTILRGAKRGSFTLASFNAKPIQDVRLDWVGEIYVTVRSGQLRRMDALARSAAARRTKAREKLAAGTGELDIGG